MLANHVCRLLLLPLLHHHQQLHQLLPRHCLDLYLGFHRWLQPPLFDYSVVVVAQPVLQRPQPAVALAHGDDADAVVVADDVVVAS